MTVSRITSYPRPPKFKELKDAQDWADRLYQALTSESLARIRDFQREKDITDLNDLANTSLADPNADRIVFWDDSDGQYEFLVANTGLAIAVNNLNLSHLGIESLSDPGADRILFWDDGETACKWLQASTGLTLSGTALTTDDSAIDHNSLSNYSANEHVDDWTITSLADDNATSVTPAFDNGALIINVTGDDAKIGYGSLITYKTTATHATAIIAGHADIEVTTGALAGTTGTNGKITVSANSGDGKVYVENRLGSTLSFHVVFIY